MPNLFKYLGYTIYFWANENFDPIHVHISKGNPQANSTKVWLTKSGNCILENNNIKIPNKDLKNLLIAIEANYFLIVSEWKAFYGTNNVKFYC